jgi:hypothetical protein
MRIIKFIPWSDVIKNTTPHPARTSVPKWWRDGELTFDSPDHPVHEKGVSNAGMKSCIPFMEVMTSGYLLKTPFDVYVVKLENGDVELTWAGPENIGPNQLPFIGQRPKELGATIPRPPGFLPNSFTWFSYWSWKTPRGYSTIVTHPFNRNELPFQTLSGIIDSDKFNLNGNIPFYLKEDFEGIIPAGTPFAQIYPFKRTKWKMFVDSSLNDIFIENQGEDLRTPKGSYKKKLWVKKEY